MLPDPSGRWLLSVDLGTDSVRSCALATERGADRTHRDPAAARQRPAPSRLPPRRRPRLRHQRTRPDGHGLPLGRRARCADRLGETRLLPDGARADAADTYPSELVVSRDGRFVWAANRGHDSLSVLALDDGGTATLVTTVPCGGHWPRDLALHPDGRHLYVANERSGDVTWFAVDPATGVPARGGSVEAPAASCVVFG